MLAGGLGTRLRPVVSDVPKPMAPVAGRPFLELLLDGLVRGGVERVVLSVGHLAHVVREHFGADYRGMEIAYVEEGRPLGTGGGLRAALAAVRGEWALVANGDTWLELDHRDLRAHHEAARRADPGLRITMVLQHVVDASRYGAVTVEEGRVVRFRSTGASGPGWINGGTYYLATALLEEPGLPERFSFERDFLEPRLGRLRPLAYEVRGRFIDIGVPEDYERAQQVFATA